MTASKKKPRSVLGDNPLSQGIFSRTETVSTPTPVTAESSKTEEIENQDNRINIKESRFLEKQEREAVNLRLPIELNDWLNDLLKNGKRKHGSKIPKEIWVQAALELFQVMPVDWESIMDEEQLRATLKNLESTLKNLDIEA